MILHFLAIQDWYLDDTFDVEGEAVQENEIAVRVLVTVRQVQLLAVIHCVFLL